jgi:hypothetical protein
MRWLAQDVRAVDPAPSCSSDVLMNQHGDDIP